MVVIKNDVLTTIYHRNSRSRGILDYFANRQKNSKTTSVDRLQKALSDENIDLTRTEIIDFFRELEDAGCGIFVVGRKGHPTRFEWTVPLIDIGRVARGDEIEVLALSNEALDSTTVTEEEANGLIKHRFVLRPNFDVHLELPEDLSPAEAGRLADYIRTLPFT